MLPVSALNTIVRNQVVPKKCGEISFNELKIEKLYNWKSFTESSTKTFALTILTLDVA